LDGLVHTLGIGCSKGILVQKIQQKTQKEQWNRRRRFHCSCFFLFLAKTENIAGTLEKRRKGGEEKWRRTRRRVQLGWRPPKTAAPSRAILTAELYRFSSVLTICI
jgi:hypothetical protein